MDKPVFYKSWCQVGISHVNQIVKEQGGTYLSPTEFENRYHTKVCPLTLFGITSTLRELWKNQKPRSVKIKINIYALKLLSVHIWATVHKGLWEHWNTEACVTVEDGFTRKYGC